MRPMSMHANTSMGLVPFDGTIRVSLPQVFRVYYNWGWCNKTFFNSTGGLNNCTAASNGHDGKTTMQLVFTVVLMALMGSTLYIEGFLRIFIPRFTHTMRLFLGRFNLEPITRILLHFAFLQFLPLLTSVFSRADVGNDGKATEAILLLLWMLLVELIRKKVQGMMLPTNGASFSREIGRFTLMDYSDELSRLVWVGFLIYTTLGKIMNEEIGLDGDADDDAAVIAVTLSILWSLGLVKLVQRAVNTWFAKTSWHTARNPLLITAYMQHFVVMGEENLVKDCKKERQKNGGKALKLVTTPGYGYGVGRRVAVTTVVTPPPAVPYYYVDQNEQKHAHVHLLTDRTKTEAKKKEKAELVTVGNIWNMRKKHPKLFRDTRGEHLEDLCLSFSLFKMLRRRFEHYPMVEVGSARTRNVMLQGLLNLAGRKDDDERPFQVLQLELDILTNYYQQAAAPVVMSQPILFFCNSVSSAIFLSVFTATVLFILIKNIAALWCGIVLFSGDFFTHHVHLYVYPIITMLLLATVIFIETYEFWALYVFSNWNIVRLLCSYGRTRGLRRRVYFLIIAVRFCAHSRLRPWFTRTSMMVQQVSIVDNCGLLDKYSARATPKPLPAKARQSIIGALKAVDPNTGAVRLPPLRGWGLHAGETTTSTETILACHLATELLEMTEHRPMTGEQLEFKAVASVLSKYCMYLVAHVPQLLPDDETWIAERHEDIFF
ncbi:unnamed protein product [Urochloa humidicola]